MTSKPKSLLTTVCSALATIVIGAAAASPAVAADRTSVRSTMQVPASIQANKLEAPATATFMGPLVARNKMDPGLVGARGEEQVIVRLNLPSVAQQGYKSDIDAQQDAAIARIAAIAPGMRVLAKTQLVLNAVFLEIDAAYLEQVAEDPSVERIAPVANYERQLAETVPYIGAATAHAAGVDGSGITVAVLDSGIDYTHANLGGGGTLADYQAAWGVGLGDPAQTSRDGLFPTADVVEGYDFVGESWPNGPLQPDDDPIDFGGHGTHVADIIGGNGGVAPGVDLIAVKVCSAVATSCSGIALVQGMEYAVDPDGDGDTSDHVDIVNMSLGSGYGQAFDDDLSLAVENATKIGVLTVASAGNCGDKPFCTGSPGAARTALSVAQTQVPSAILFFMNVVEPAAQAGPYEAVKYDWTPSPAGLIEGVVQYADGAGGNLNGCAVFPAGSLDGLIVAVDRGACAFSQKLQNIEAAGGVLGIVMLVAPGAPFAGAFAGGPPVNIPGFNISQADGEILRAGGASVQFGPDFTESLAGYTVGSSGRGPDMSYNAIKPEIGAPGASLSAEVGTGTGETVFGGTSGASPMVAGAAALVLSDCDDSKKSRGWGWGWGWSNHHNSKKEKCSPLAIKSRLVNTGYRDILSDTTGGLAEISRIGGGEVRADKALDAPFWAYSAGDDQPVLSLGQIDASRDTSIYRFIKIENLSNRTQRINVTPTFRFADDEAAGAIDIWTRDRVTVGKNGKAYLLVKFRINADALPANYMNSGSEGANPAALGLNEFDGYIVMTSQDGEIAIPWHVMTRKAANVKSDRSDIVSGFPDSISVTNYGAGAAQNDTYSIIGVSDEMPRGDEGAQSPTPDIRSVGVNTIPVPAGFCSADPSFLWLFAVNTWDRQSHLMPVSHQIYLDIDQDGIDDYAILNRDVTFNDLTDGRQYAWAYDLATGTANAFFFAEHATSTGNTALIVCAEQVGLTGADILARNVNVSVVAQDFYYGGPGDFIGGITVTPLGEQYFGATSDLAAGESGVLDVYDYGPFPGNTPEHGVMMFTNGDRGAGARGGATESTEALLFIAPGATAPEELPKKHKHRWHWD